MADEYLWLVYTEIALFSVVSIVCVIQLVLHYRIKSPAQGSAAQSAGWSFRKYFHVLLCLANSARTASLILEIALDNDNADSMRAWWNSLAHSFPSLLFLSTYSVLILFWAQLYYAATLVSYPLLRPTFVFLNISIYCIFVVVSMLTAMLHAYSEYQIYTLFIIGVIHLIVAAGFIYYGVKVSVQLSSRKNRYTFSARSMVLKRVLFLAIFCTVIFLVRGAYDVAVATHLFQDYYPEGASHYAWDGLVFFIAELLPSVVILILTRRRAADANVPVSEAERPLATSIHLTPGGSLIHSGNMKPTNPQDIHSLLDRPFGDSRSSASGRGVQPWTSSEL
eukprot:GILK01003859.1.p1 GENE.GILK01003859.1~~GILK01003859.1.p1  ORF type:complete len:336 (+),score=34.51 GILK01003859.1:62-1069(+)